MPDDYDPDPVTLDVHDSVLGQDTTLDGEHETED